MKEKYETCRHAGSIRNIAVFAKPTCPRAIMVKGTLVTSKKRCRECKSWEKKEGEDSHD